MSDFHIGDARGKKTQEEGIHLSSSGDHLPSVAYRLKEEEPAIFNKILAKMRSRVPGISDIDAKVGDDGSLLIRYSDGAFKDPFLDYNVSDGTIKMFAYMVLLHDPMPHKILSNAREPDGEIDKVGRRSEGPSLPGHRSAGFHVAHADESLRPVTQGRRIAHLEETGIGMQNHRVSRAAMPVHEIG